MVVLRPQGGEVAWSKSLYDRRDVMLENAKSNKFNEITPCDINECKFFDGCVSNVDTDRLRLIEQIIPNCHKVFALNPELIRFVPKNRVSAICQR